MNDNQSPLGYAITCGNDCVEIWKILYSHGAKCTAADITRLGNKYTNFLSSVKHEVQNIPTPAPAPVPVPAPAPVPKEEVQEIFNKLRTETSQELKERIEQLINSGEIQVGDTKAQMVAGKIPVADWSIQWSPIHSRNQELEQSIAKKQENLEKLEKEMEILKKENKKKKQ